MKFSSESSFFEPICRSYIGFISSMWFGLCVLAWFWVNCDVRLDIFCWRDISSSKFSLLIVVRGSLLEISASYKILSYIETNYVVVLVF